MNSFQQRDNLKSVVESQFAEAYESDEDREVILNRTTTKEQQHLHLHKREPYTRKYKATKGSKRQKPS